MSLLQKWLFHPNSALCEKFYPRNIRDMPAEKFFTCLDFELKFSFCKRLKIDTFFFPSMSTGKRGSDKLAWRACLPALYGFNEIGAK
jgi:hypothetical protein